jgi:ubiquinone/menaquinone biosynthesis C-methylase UbiE
MTALKLEPGSTLEPATDSAVSRSRYDRIAGLYDLLDLGFEYCRYRPLRPRLLDGLSGIILDAGVGTGRNMPFYPEGARVVGIDVSAGMLTRARQRRDSLGMNTELLEMDVLETTFPDRHFDAIVATFLFCVLEAGQQLPALRELARICKPGGQIRVLEYSYSKNPFRRFVMHIWVPWVRWAFGAAFDRNTEQYLAPAGLECVEMRYLYHDIIKLIVARPMGGGPRRAPAAIA